jgi:PAS domain-containing protein
MAARAPSSRSKPFTAAIHELAARTDAAVLLDLEGTILFTNEAWERHTRTTGAYLELAVGAHLVEGIQGEVPRKVFQELIARVARPPARPLSITTECNGPDLARLVTTHFTPVLAGTEAIGLTMVLKVVRELPATEVYQVVEGAADDYRSTEGVLEQCGCCRRTHRPSDPAEWDFVPALVAAPPEETTFAYCPLCQELHDPLGGRDPEA